jgi:hypothetical protein
LENGREAWRVAVEKLQKGEDWRGSLKECAIDSQHAATAALLSSLSLFLGTAGPLQDAISVHNDNSVEYWRRTLKARDHLEAAQAILHDAASSPTASAEARRAAAELSAVTAHLPRA